MNSSSFSWISWLAFEWVFFRWKSSLWDILFLEIEKDNILWKGMQIVRRVFLDLKFFQNVNVKYSEKFEGNSWTVEIQFIESKNFKCPYNSQFFWEGDSLMVDLTWSTFKFIRKISFDEPPITNIIDWNIFTITNSNFIGIWNPNDKCVTFVSITFWNYNCYSQNVVKWRRKCAINMSKPSSLKDIIFNDFFHFEKLRFH